MKRAVLLFTVFACVLAAQDRDPAAGGERPWGAELARVLGLEADGFRERLGELRRQMGSQREAMKPDLEALRVLAGQLNEAKRLNLRGGNNDAEVGNLLMKVERQRMKIEEIKKQNHEANLATVKSWGPRAESGLGTIQRAARLRPAIEQAARLGLVRVPEPRDRRR